MEWYVALLRGINVGGRNKIAMVDLRTCFEEMGFVGVRTYIQSGNVVFGTEERDKRKLGERVEAGLSERFGFEIRVALRSQAEMAAVLASAPEGFGSEPDLFRYDVFFLMEPLTAKEVAAQLNPKEGVDDVWAGEGVVYTRRLTSRATQSRMGRIAGMPFYGQITIRNWRTTERLGGEIGD